MTALGRAGQDMRPAGGPYTIAGAQPHRPVWGAATATVASGRRWDTVAGSVMNPPQV